MCTNNKQKRTRTHKAVYAAQTHAVYLEMQGCRHPTTHTYTARQIQTFLHACPSLTARWTSKRSLRPQSVILLSLPGCFVVADMVDVDVYFVQIIHEMRWEEVGGIVLPVVLSPWAITLSGGRTQRRRRLPQTSAKSQLIAKEADFTL